MSAPMPRSGSVDVFRLMYRSRNRIPGALLLSADWFVQVLEGEEGAVRALFASIERDPRHAGVTLLDTRPVPERVFARWAMARVSDDGERDIPLIAHTDGISPAAGRPTTPEQDELLAVMRAALRTSTPTG